MYIYDMMLMLKSEYLVVPKVTKFAGSGKLGLKVLIEALLDSS